MEIDARVIDRRLAGRHGELRKAVESTGFLHTEASVAVPIVDLTPEMDLKVGRIEQCQVRNTTSALKQTRPERFERVAEGRDHAQTRDDDAAWHYLLCSSM